MSGIDNGNNSLFPKVIPITTNIQPQKSNAQGAQEVATQHAQQQGSLAKLSDAPASPQAAMATMALVQGALKANVPKFSPSNLSLNPKTISTLANADFATMLRDLADDSLTDEGIMIAGKERSILLDAATSRFLNTINDLA